MNLARTIVAACLAMSLAGPAIAYDQLPPGLARLTPATVADRIEVIDEELEPHIVVTTRDAWARGRSINGAHANDVHLRALVDREGGGVRWQVWHELVYAGSGAPEMVGVNYLAGGELRQDALTAAEHWYDGCPALDALKVACNRHARYVFDLPGEVIREIADAYSPGDRTPWRLRFKDANGREITGGVAPAEAAGLLAAVKRLRAPPAEPR